MNEEHFQGIVDETVSSINKLLKVKGGEYANSEDRLANFKRGAALTGCTPLQVLFVYLSKHYDGVASFVKSSAVGNVRESSEPIEGRLDDIINYCILAKALIAEQAMVDVRSPSEYGGRVLGESTLSARPGSFIRNKSDPG